MSSDAAGDAREFDVVVIGAGPAGEVCAGRLAEAGLAVAIVEDDLVGGECSYYACMPSKALLRPAQVLAEARRVQGAAQAISGPLDIEAVLSRREEIVHGREDAAQLPWLESRGIELVRGCGRLAGEREVHVGEQRLLARRAVVLATGSYAAVPPIPGLQDARAWTNREATSASEIPRSLLVLGGGVVGVEMAQAYRTLGADVTLIEAGPRLIAAEEEFAAEMLQQSLEELGVKVLVEATATGAGREDPSGPVTLNLDDGTSVSADELLVGVGRRPHSEHVGLEEVGLQAGEYVSVDDSLRAPNKDWLYAVGDVNGRSLLTHMGKYQARLAARAILGEEVGLRSDGRLSPRVIFTEPQIAAVGHTLASAREAGIDARAVDVDVEGNAGGSFIGHGAAGRARIVTDESRGLLVGATFAGIEVAESLHAATIAVIGEVPLERLWHAVPCFPTRSELWLYLLEAHAREASIG